jgi:anti-sigma regulatory factor (Ser/Thr protein kinase)
VEAHTGPPPLRLRSDLSELTRVAPWLNDLSARLQLPRATQYAIDLCLEEALSNIIRHGYAGQEGTIVVRRLSMREGELRLMVEDAAKPFEPPAGERAPARGLDDSRAGGFGLDLIRRFATTVEYERIGTGNRLTLGFSWR